jgi:hypothetical protein
MAHQGSKSSFYNSGSRYQSTCKSCKKKQWATGWSRSFESGLPLTCIVKAYLHTRNMVFLYICSKTTSNQGCQIVYLKPKIAFLVCFGGPWNGKVVIFSVHLEYFMTIRYILWPFGTFCGHWEIASFGYVVPRKSGNPASNIGRRPATRQRIAYP